MSVSGIRQWLIFRPLAVLLAILMLPAIPSRRSTAFQAEAQTTGLCEAAGGNTIVQKYCGATGAPVIALNNLEADAVRAYLALHGLPETDANLIRSLGRKDLRNAIRALMLTQLIAIANKPVAERTQQERDLHNWFQALVQRNEIDYYSAALSHFSAFRADPCAFRLDSTVADALNISYDFRPFCFNTNFASLFSGPPVPSSDYFLMYGMSQSYAKMAKDFDYAAEISADTQLNAPAIAGITAAAAGIITYVALATFFTFVVANGTIALGAAVVSAATIGVIGGTLAAASGPAAFIVIAATLLVMNGIEVFENQKQLNNLANLSQSLAQARTTPPDIAAMAKDSTGLGFQKLNLTLVGETLPDVPSTAPLPQSRPSVDPIFRIEDFNGNVRFFSELTYQDWNETLWSASAWNGWLVQRCLNDKGVQTCKLRDSITGTIRFLDWSRAKWTASRIGNRFTLTKLSPAATDQPCPADPATGVTPATDFSKCSSYVSDVIPMRTGGGVGAQSRVSLSPFQAPAFTGPTQLSFSPGLASSVQIVATGNPTPTICATIVGTPALISMPSCSPSPFTISYNGTGSPPIGGFPLRLTATNETGSRTQDFIVNIGTDVKIITPAILNTSYKQQVNFTIVAAGSPKPRFTVDPGVDLRGLSFRDNLDGTATISGTAGPATIFGPCEDIVGQTCPRIRASNGLTSDSQIFTVLVDSPPTPGHVGPFTYTAPSGVSSEFALASTGSTTPVTWNMIGDAPSWIRLVSVAGVGRVTVSPPRGTSGVYTVRFAPSAEGGAVSLVEPYTFNVTNIPVFTSSNLVSFTVGNPAPVQWNIAANLGTVSTANVLPPGLTSQPDPANSALSLVSQPGQPPRGSGGQYRLPFTSTAAEGTAVQDVTVQIFEQPSITGDPLAVMFAGRPGEFLLGTTGFPSTGSVLGVSSAPVSPAQGFGMFFTTQGLPPSLQTSNLNTVGYTTGTLRISGTPAANEAGTYRVNVTAANGVGAPAQRTFTLIVYPYAPTTSVQLLTTSAVTRDASNILATVVVANAGRDAAQNVALSSVRLNGVAGTITPASVASIAPASSATFTVQFPANAAAPGGGVLSVAGRHSGGNFSSGARVVVP